MTEPLTEPLIDSNSKLFTEEMDMDGWMENEIDSFIKQCRYDDLHPIHHSNFGTTKEDCLKAIAKRRKYQLAKGELRRTFAQHTSACKLARVRCACKK